MLVIHTYIHTCNILICNVETREGRKESDAADRMERKHRFIAATRGERGESKGKPWGERGETEQNSETRANKKRKDLGHVDREEKTRLYAQ